MRIYIKVLLIFFTLFYFLGQVQVNHKVQVARDVGDIFFVGDSTTYHLKKVGIDEKRLLVPESHTLKLSSDILSVRVGDDDKTIAQKLASEHAAAVIITLGVNGADSFSEIRYKTYYGKLIDEIKVKSPTTDIIIQSVFPVTIDYSNMELGITNQGIDRINVWAKELASEKGVCFLDTQSILKNELGALIDDYNEGDGVHLNALGYRVVLDYIRRNVNYGV